MPFETVYEKNVLIPVRFYDSDSSESDGHCSKKVRPPDPPDVPTSEYTVQTPTCLVMDRRHEKRTSFTGPHQIDYGYLHGEDGTLPDVRTHAGQGLALYDMKEFVSDPGKMVVGCTMNERFYPPTAHLWPVDAPQYRGIHVQFPYFVGVVSDTTVLPKLDFAFTFDTTSWDVALNVGFRVEVDLPDGSIWSQQYDFDEVPAGSIRYTYRTFFLPHAHMSGLEKNRFHPYYCRLMWINDNPLQMVKFNTNQVATASNAIPRRGYHWVCTNVYTFMPIGYNFEVRTQHRSWLHMGLRCTYNTNRSLYKPHIGHARQNVWGPPQFSWNMDLTQPRPFRLGVRNFWDTYSQVSTAGENMDAFWWNIHVKTLFPGNHKFKLPIFMQSVQGIPSIGVGVVGLPINYTYISSENDPFDPYAEYLANPTGWEPRGKAFVFGNQAGFPMVSWLDPDEWDNWDDDLYLHMPYNCQVLVHLKEGPAFNDSWMPGTGQTGTYPVHNTNNPTLCLWPYPYIVPDV